MFERTTRRSVTFTKPFFLPGVEGEQPAGTYEVLTEEELIQGLSFVAYRRTSTTMTLLTDRFGSSQARQVVTIDPEDLEAALSLDGRLEPARA